MSLPPVILLGGHENVVPLVRSFAARSIPVYVLNERRAEIGYSRYARRIPLPPEPPYPQSAMEFLTGPASDALRGSVLLAGCDEELQLIAKHREMLAGKFRLDLSNPVAQQIMLDKLATYRAALCADVTTPRFWEVSSEEDIHRLRDELVYPLIIKPKSSHVFYQKFAAKFVVADDFQELLDR